MVGEAIIDTLTDDFCPDLSIFVLIGLPFVAFSGNGEGIVGNIVFTGEFGKGYSGDKLGMEYWPIPLFSWHRTDLREWAGWRTQIGERR